MSRAAQVRFRAMISAMAAAAAFMALSAGGEASAQAATTCTWGGTPLAPTGVITFSPGVTNTPSTGPIQFKATGPLGSEGCNGQLTFTGYIEPGTTCAVNAPFHAKAAGLRPVKWAEAQAGVAGSQPVLLYDADGNVVGSEQAQFLTTVVNQSDPAYMSCGTAEGLTRATWSDTVELFANQR